MESDPTSASNQTRDPVSTNTKVKAIFDDVSDLPPDLREAYLNEHCGADAEVRRAVEKLLTAHEEAGPFLAQPTRGLPAGEPALSQMIGRYKLLQRIGEGGFGTVYMAEQEHPVRRRVALKIIKLGMDTKAVIARFEAERQALAMMDHPNIARVFDAGATDAGRPYFVMELVHGIPITQYCDTNKLSTRERLELFVPVCRAVQHAHQKGIIHRDIKPTNVLVTLHDGLPVPKVIDFGIAKATSQRLTEKTLFTEFRQFIGTPEYMSPEQAEMSGLDIDTRSDIYALGVLLYELLTGTTPFDAKALRAAAYGEIQRIIREVEPPRPSSRISTLGKTLATVAACRGIDSRKFSQLMRGELDSIVMKCMEKDRTRRYDTATSVAADIQRYLNDEAVEASPPSTTYRLRKFARKYRRPLRAAVLFTLLLIIATIFSSWEAVRATRARAAALVEKQRANDEAIIANRFAESLQQMLGSADPSAGKGLDYTVRQLLDNFADGMESRLTGQPEVLAMLHATIGRAYTNLGQFDKAELHLASALELRRQIFGVNDQKYAESLVDSAWESLLAKSDRKELEIQLRDALAIYRVRGVGGRPVLYAIWALANVLQRQERWKEVEAADDEALAEARKSPGVEYGEIASIHHALVQAKIAEGDYPAAEGLARESLALHLRLDGLGSPETGWGYCYLGRALRAENRFPEAMEAEKQSLAIFFKVFPQGSMAYASVISDMNITLVAAADSSALVSLFPAVQDVTDLEPLIRPSLAVKARGQTTWDNPAIAASECFSTLVGTYLQLSRELTAAGRTEEAEESRRRGMALVDSIQPDSAVALRARGLMYVKMGQPEKAVLDATRGVELDPKDDSAWAFRGEMYRRIGQFAKMAEDYSQAIQLNPQKQWYWHERAYAYRALGEHKKAIADDTQTIELGDSDSNERWRRGHSHEALGDFAKAEEDYSRAIELNPVDWNNWYARARLNAQQGLSTKAQADLVKATQCLPKPLDQNDFAWALVAAPIPQLSDPKLAVDWAEKAVAGEPNEASNWNTLGAAQYRAGNWLAAVTASNKSMELRNGGDAYDWIFLAMANYQLEKPGEARMWYDRAVKWADENPPIEDIHRFQAEAQALIGRSSTTNPSSQPATAVPSAP